MSSNGKNVLTIVTISFLIIVVASFTHEESNIDNNDVVMHTKNN